MCSNSCVQCTGVPDAETMSDRHRITEHSSPWSRDVQYSNDGWHWAPTFNPWLKAATIRGIAYSTVQYIQRIAAAAIHELAVWSEPME